MYRAVTWLALDRGVDLDDAGALAALAESARLRIGPPPADGRETCSITVNGRDVTNALRDAAVERNVSQVSAVPAVRRVLVRLQRDAAPADVVMAGRDIGTVVCPEADLKIYLDASPSERARRRLRQFGAGTDDEQAVLESIQARDRIDSERALAPLAKAADAETIETDDLSIDQVVDRVVELLRGRVSGLGKGPSQQGPDAPRERR